MHDHGTTVEKALGHLPAAQRETQKIDAMS